MDSTTFLKSSELIWNKIVNLCPSVETIASQPSLWSVIGELIFCSSSKVFKCTFYAVHEAVVELTSHWVQPGPVLDPGSCRGATLYRTIMDSNHILNLAQTLGKTDSLGTSSSWKSVRYSFPVGALGAVNDVIFEVAFYFEKCIFYFAINVKFYETDSA